MPNALLYLAVKVTDKQIRENLLQRILRLFQQLGKDIVTPEDRVRFLPSLYLMSPKGSLISSHSGNGLFAPNRSRVIEV